jgi:hypothetical protein
MLVRKIAGRGDAARGRRVPTWPTGESNRQRGPLVRYFGRVARMGKAPSQEQCLTGAGHRRYSHGPQFSKQDGSHIRLPITRASKA